MTALNLAQSVEAAQVPSKRVIANRLNARKSTGPKTREGKEASRRNALKTGLTGAGVVASAEVEAEIGVKIGDYVRVYKPKSDQELNLVRHAATITVLLNRCWDDLDRARAYAAHRAETGWEQDRADEAEAIFAGLAKAPARTVARLRKSYHGAKLLRSRWMELGSRIENDRDWSEPQCELALDLLGVPEEFRDDLSPVAGDAADREALLDQRFEIVVERIDELDAIIELLEECDAIDRELVASGSLSPLDPMVRKLMAYEQRLANRSLKLDALLEKTFGQPTSSSAPERTPAAPVPPKPGPKPAASEAGSAAKSKGMKLPDRMAGVRTILDRDEETAFLTPDQRRVGNEILAAYSGNTEYLDIPIVPRR